MMRVWIGLLAILVCLGLTQAAPAQEAGEAATAPEEATAPEAAESSPAARPARRGRTFWRNPNTVELLALTPEQCGELEAGEAEFAARNRELAEQVSEIQEELEGTLAEDRFSPEKANRLRDELAKLAAERAALAADRQIAVRRVLTADQWAELRAEQEARAERRQMMRQRMEQGMRRGPRAGRRGGAADAGTEPEAAE